MNSRPVDGYRNPELASFFKLCLKKDYIGEWYSSLTPICVANVGQQH